METSDTGIDFTQAFTQMEPIIATVLGNMKQWSAFKRQTDDPRIGGVCISDEMNIVLMSKEQYGKILKEIKIPNVTTTREDIIRVHEAMTELYGLRHYPKSPIILDTMNLRNSAEKNVILQLYSSSKRIVETNRQRTVTIICTMVYA